MGKSQVNVADKDGTRNVYGMLDFCRLRLSAVPFPRSVLEQVITYT